MMEYLTQEFVTPLKVKDVIVAEMKMSASHHSALVLTGLLEDI